MSEFLFPNRRQFLATSAVAALSPSLLMAESSAKPVEFGADKMKFTLDPKWGQLSEGMGYGFGCAIVVDSKDRIFVTSRSAKPCVAIFDASGKLLETWSQDFAEKIGYTTQQVAATAHGLYWSKEPEGEFLYWTENAPGKRVYKTDMNGKVLYMLGAVKEEGSTSQKFKFDNPTDVAVGKNGDIYIVDGYGSQLVHRFDKNFKLIKTMGGKGKEHGKFQTCHGIWARQNGKTEEIYIADRANNRLEVFDPELRYVRTVEGVRNPCCFYEQGEFLFVPELDRRVTVFDGADKVVAHLGDGKGLDAKKIAEHPEAFFAPHALTVDSKGNLYVIEWVPFGRPRKLTKV